MISRSNAKVPHLVDVQIQISLKQTDSKFIAHDSYMNGSVAMARFFSLKLFSNGDYLSAESFANATTNASFSIQPLQ